MSQWPDGAPFAVVFLEVDEVCDPSAVVLALSNSHDVPIRPASQAERLIPCRYPTFWEYRDRATKARGALVSVGTVDWVAPGKAEVTYGWNFANLAGRSWSVTVTKTDSGWQVAQTGYQIIS